MLLVEAAEREPSMHDLVDGWLARMPFLSLDDFTWTEHFKSAIAKVGFERGRGRELAARGVCRSALANLGTDSLPFPLLSLSLSPPHSAWQTTARRCSRPQC